MIDEIKYKFDEPEIIDEIKKYIDNTYEKHYSSKDAGKIQTFELINKIPIRGYFFCIGNILKYSDRIGLKNDPRDELMKIIHYGILAISTLNEMNENEMKIVKMGKESSI